MELNYQNKGRKLFEGLKISNGFGGCTFNAWFARFVTPEYFFEDSEYQPEIQFNLICNWNEEEERFRESTDANDTVCDSIKCNVQHELMHYLHFLNDAQSFFDYRYKYAEMLEDIDMSKEISRYAMQDSRAFVAEYLTGRLNGKQYSKEAEELCRIFGGPDLFNS